MAKVMCAVRSVQWVHV